MRSPPLRRKTTCEKHDLVQSGKSLLKSWPDVKLIPQTNKHINMSSLFDSLLLKVIHYLKGSVRENREFWEKVKADEKHPFYFSCLRLKSYCSEDNRLHIFKEELRAAISSALKSQDITRNIAYLIISNDEDRIRQDLRSEQSIIIQSLADVVKIGINVYTLDGRFYHFPSCSGLYKQHTPLVIQWSKDADRFIDPDLYYQYKPIPKKCGESLIADGRKGFSKGVHASEKHKRKRRKSPKPRYKSSELISSSDSDESNASFKKILKFDEHDLEKIQSKKQSSLGFKKRADLDAKQDKVNDLSSLRDLDLTDSDAEGYEDKLRKEDLSLDFEEELTKLQKIEISTSSRVKKDLEVKVSESGKGWKNSHPFLLCIKSMLLRCILI